jgi:hypothetical protein
MRTFKQFPETQTCPICKTSENKECVLAAIDGTQEGHNAQAQVFHLDCIDLWYYPKDGILAQKFSK